MGAKETVVRVRNPEYLTLFQGQNFFDFLWLSTQSCLQRYIANSVDFPNALLSNTLSRSRDADGIYDF